MVNLNDAHPRLIETVLGIDNLFDPPDLDRGGVNHHAKFHARMFAPDMGIAEDPATGAAVAAMSGAIHFFDKLVDGHHPLLIEQGVEMGRRSHIHLHLDVSGGAIVGARIGGEAVRIASGTLDL